ncbi:cell wall-binding repeat-containing protein [Candidatus Poriferisodalis sp.]|uniref:cell wall-binding repeat-containing protein n=1 Tax=Candidatus Poriferisodalis sp. TaxID=3101277 RepID=UPI003B51FBF0
MSAFIDVLDRGGLYRGPGLWHRWLRAMRIAPLLLLIGALLPLPAVGAAVPVSGGVVVVANGWSPPDAGAAAPLAGRLGGSVLYGAADGLGDSSARALVRLAPARVIMVGGPAALSASVEAEIRGLLGSAIVERLSGTDRVDTAARAALVAPVTGQQRPVVIANGRSAADVGAAAPLATALGGSVLYATDRALGAPTGGALEQLAPSRIVLVGGTAALSESIETELGGLLADARVERLAGTDRFDTAARAASLAQLPNGRPVVIANGRNPASVGIAAPLAATLRGSVLFANADRLGTAASDALKTLRPLQVVLIGSYVELGDSVAAEVRELLPEASVTRISGVDRLDTAARAAIYGQTPAAERDGVDTIAPNVRVLYAAPADREFRPDYSEGIEHALVDLQSWYRQQLGGLTFSLYDATPEHCQMDMPADFYAPDSWNKVVEGVQHCAPVEGFTSEFVWVIYADVGSECDDPNSLGRGGPGLTILGRDDLEGLVGNRLSYYDQCGYGPFAGPVRRWIGGMGHELGHALGLPHPPGCDAGLPTCDGSALMFNGYGDYPDTYLRADEKELLIRSPFMGSQRAVAPDPTHSVRVRGTVRDPDGRPADGARISLAADAFWSWATVGGDGTFEVSLPSGAMGSAVLSVHAHDAAPCRWLGYHSPSGLTSVRENATLLDIGHDATAGITITLPSSLDDVCDQRATISGTLTGPNGNPVEGILIWAWNRNVVESGSAETGSDGTFAISVAAGTFSIDVYAARDGSCAGYYDGSGVTADGNNVHLVEVVVAEAREITIRLSMPPDSLEGIQC